MRGLLVDEVPRATGHDEADGLLIEARAACRDGMHALAALKRGHASAVRRMRLEEWTRTCPDFAAQGSPLVTR